MEKVLFLKLLKRRDSLKRKQHVEKEKEISIRSVCCKSEREKNLLHVRLIPERAHRKDARKSRK